MYDCGSPIFLRNFWKIFTKGKAPPTNRWCYFIFDIWFLLCKCQLTSTRHSYRSFRISLCDTSRGIPKFSGKVFRYYRLGLSKSSSLLFLLYVSKKFGEPFFKFLNSKYFVYFCGVVYPPNNIIPRHRPKH